MQVQSIINKLMRIMSSVNFFIAKKHLLTRRKQTLLAMAGVALSITSYIVITSVITGVNNVMDRSGYTPHIRLYKNKLHYKETYKDTINGKTYLLKIWHWRPENTKSNFKNASEIMAILQKQKEVKYVSPVIIASVYFSYANKRLDGIIDGTDIFNEDKMFRIKNKIISGDMSALEKSKNGILLGTGLAQKLGIHVNEDVKVYTLSGNLLQLKVLGIFKTGLSAIDKIQSYVTIKTAHNILQTNNNYISDIYVMLHNPDDAENASAKFKYMFGCESENWKVANAVMLQGIKIRNLMTYIISATLLIISGFGIYNIMNITISNKLKDISIIKAMGFTGSDTKHIFLSQTIIIGIIGGFLSMIIAFTICQAISTIPFNAVESYDLRKFPVVYDIKFYIIGFFMGLVICILAGYFPANKASKVDPVSIFRG